MIPANTPLLRSGFIALLMIALVGVGACDDDNPTAPSGQIESVSGLITSDGNNGLPNAFVQALDAEQTLIDSDSTDADGNFLLENLPTSLDDVSLRVAHINYGAVTLNLKSVINSSSKKDGSDLILKLDSLCCGVITICAVTGDPAEVLENVNITLRENGDELKSLKTNGDGKVTFNNVCEGEYDVRLKLEGYHVLEKEFAIDSCDTLTLKLSMEPEKDECCDNKVTVKVTDKGGNVIEGVNAWLRQEGKVLQEGKSNGDGVIVFDEVCEGNYDIKLSKDGYIVQEIEIEVECDKDQTIESTLTKEDDACCDGVLRLTVKDKDGKAIKNARVGLWRDGKLIDDPRTNGDGVVVIDGLCEGKYGIGLTAEGYAGIEFEVEIGCDEDKSLEKQLEPAEEKCCDNTVTVKITDKDGKAIEGVNGVIRWEGKNYGEGKSNGDGVITFYDICEGKYEIRIAKEGLVVQEFIVEVGCEDKTVERTMEAAEEECCTGILRLTVTDKETGNAINNARVVLYRNGKAVEDPRTNAEGKVVIDGLCEGAYGVDISAEGYDAIEFEFEIDCDEDKSLEKQLTPAEEKCCDNTVTVKITDKAGNALEGVNGVIRWEGKNYGEGKSNGDGVITFNDICEGKYEIRIAKEGWLVQEFIIEVGCEDKTVERAMESAEEECCDGILRLTVTDKETGEPVNNARVGLWRDGKLIEDPRTNAEGKVVIDGLCKGNYGVGLTAEGYDGIEFEFEIGCDEDKSLEKTLTPKGDECCDATLRVKVRNDDDESALQNATVKVRQEGKVIAEGKTNADGVVEFDGLCEGTYSLLFQRDGFKSAEANVEVECDRENNAQKDLLPNECCDALLKHIVIDKTTEARIEGATVKVYYNGTLVEDASTNGDGIAIVDGLCAPRTYVIVISKDGYKTAEYEFRFEKCDDLQETFRIEKN